MEDFSFLREVFEVMQTQTRSPLLGGLWLLIVLVFRMFILGTVASDLFEDEQEQFECNTAQPGCKQVCYDQAFPISQYRFWVFHIVLISTPALLFLMYSMHLRSKTAASHQDGEVATEVANLLRQAVSTLMAQQQQQQQPPTTTNNQQQQSRTNPRESRAASSVRKSVEPSQVSDPSPWKPMFDGLSVEQDRRVTQLYVLNVGFRFLAEVAFLLSQGLIYGFHVAAQYPCSRFPCPYTVDCFTSRPMEKTIFLRFYFSVGLLSALFSLAEIVHVFAKWRRRRRLAKVDMAGSGDGADGTGESRSLQSQSGERGGGGGGGTELMGDRGGGDVGVLELLRDESGGEGLSWGRSGTPNTSNSSKKGWTPSLGGRSSSRNASNAGRKSRRSGSQKLDPLTV